MRKAFVWLLGALSVTLLAACAPSSDPVGDVSKGPARGDALDLTIRDGAFDPTTIELDPGAEVTVEVTNDDDTAHDFAIEEIGLNTGTIEPGEVATATFEAPNEATEFACTFHSGMTGRIVP